MLPIPNAGAFTAADIQAILGNFSQLRGLGTGNVYFLDPVNGNDGNDGLSPVNLPGLTQPIASGPVASFAQGYALLTNGNDDTLVIIGNGLSTGSVRIHAAFVWAKNACHLLGVCAPSRLAQRARVATLGTDTAFANFFTVSGSGCIFQNLEFFQGFNTPIAAEICMTLSGTRCVFNNCSISGMADTGASAGAASSTSRCLLIKGGGEHLFTNCSIGVNTIARTAANANVEFANGTVRNVFENCLFPESLATSATVLGVKMLAGGGDRFQLFNGCQFINGINSSGVSVTGLGSIGANGGGPNGIIVYQNCILVGIAEWEQTTKTSAYVGGPAVSSSMGIGVNPA